ncbi:MAG: flagellar hook-associated protein FlgK, partial [Deltaproteobacteria bacterium]|nr:flagellar hook-associated protein FlgK [Deltaproteobacteria bacterium]
MSGIGLILNAAKDALMSQQYALDVISHNVANANTEGYSRQTPVLSAKTPAPYAGFILGRGVELSEVIRNTDSFIESRLRERNSDLTAMSEKEVYLNALEGVFNENSGRSLSAQFADFWNAWHDLSNNPSGYAERDVVVEMGSLLAQSFKDLAGDMQQFEREIGLALDSGITKINQLTSQIADVNEQIINLEIIGSANDLRDKRDALVIELSKYINIKAFENEDGNLTVMTTSGYTLVDKSSTYQLELSGTNIMWEGSGGVDVNITDSIEGGKMGGWLDMRDEILPKYEADLDELAKAAIWEVNKIHTQGVGLEIVQPGDSLTGTYTSSTTLSDL